MQCISVILAILALVAGGFSDTHVFWYKAFERGYNLQANPGPSILPGAIVHQGMIMSAGVNQQIGYDTDLFYCGSGLDDRQGRCAVV